MSWWWDGEMQDCDQTVSKLHHHNKKVSLYLEPNIARITLKTTFFFSLWLVFSSSSSWILLHSMCVLGWKNWPIWWRGGGWVVSMGWWLQDSICKWNWKLSFDVWCSRKSLILVLAFSFLWVWRFLDSYWELISGQVCNEGFYWGT